MLKNNDLIVTNPSGASYGYVLYNDRSFGDPCIHTETDPNLPLSVGYSTPAQAGGVYDVRDSDGDKSIAHVNWIEGGNQKSLDTEDASPYRFWDSRNIDVSVAGEFKLNREMEFERSNISQGAVWSGLGYFFTESMKASTTGADGTWTQSTGISGANGICNDGSYIYAATGSGVYQGALSGGVWDFQAFGSTPGTENCVAIAYNGGQLFVVIEDTTDTRVCMVDMVTGELYKREDEMEGEPPAPTGDILNSEKSTPFMLNDAVTVALVSSGNAVYWVVVEGYRSYAYKISYDPSTQAMITEQYMETPDGFVATSACGYLSSLYVGGYYTSLHANVGKGAVYENREGWTGPLFEIGEIPENTPEPASTINDNRIWHVVEAGKDLYVATSRDIWKWDIDDTGLSHFAVVNSEASGAATVIYNADSTYQFDASNLPTLPSKWTRTDQGSVTWTAVSGAAVLVGDGYTTLTCTPSYPYILSVAGNTMEIVTGVDCDGEIVYTVSDTRRQAKFKITKNYVSICPYIQSYTRLGPYYKKRWVYAYAVNKPNPDAIDMTTAGHPMRTDGTRRWGWLEEGDPYYLHEPSGNYYWYGIDTLPDDEYIFSIGNNTVECSGERTVRFVLQSNTAYAFVNGSADAMVLSTRLKTVTGAGSASLKLTSGAQIKSWDFDSNTAWFTGTDWEVNYVLGLAWNRGRLLCTYQVPSTTYYYTATINTTYAEEGYLTQSETSLHSGTIQKNFRCIDVSHEPLPDGSSIGQTAWVDGVQYQLVPQTISETSTRFVLNATGYSIQTKTTLMRDGSGYSSPVVKSINVFYNFVKTKKNQYVLHCAAGAKEGHWTENPQKAITHLFTSANERCTFEDAFNGYYMGVITSCEFLKANHSDQEGYSGVVRIMVREEA